MDNDLVHLGSATQPVRRWLMARLGFPRMLRAKLQATEICQTGPGGYDQGPLIYTPPFARD